MASLTDLELTRFFFALVLLLLFAHTFRFILNWFKLPRVVGEIFGGLLLGPTVLGFFFPEAYQWLFAAFDSEGKLLSLIPWLGLVLLMFISGFEIQRSFDQADRKIILALILGSTLPPFIAGWIAPLFYDFSPYLGVKQNQLALQLVIAIATAITSIPVISRIFLDLKIMNTRFAKIVLTIATIHDVLLWVILAIATGLVNSETSSASETVSTILLTLLFFGIALLLMPRVVGYVSTLRWNLVMRSSSAGYILFICFLFAAFASFLNVNIVLVRCLQVSWLASSRRKNSNERGRMSNRRRWACSFPLFCFGRLEIESDPRLRFAVLFIVPGFYNDHSNDRHIDHRPNS